MLFTTLARHRQYIGGAFMALLSRKVDYALLDSVVPPPAARRGQRPRDRGPFELSRAFVANILKLLCHKGFVVSHRGVKGGYVLQRPADEIALAELMDALDDSFHLAECNKTAPSSRLCAWRTSCPLRGAIGEVHRRIRDVLRNVTLAELFGPAEDSSDMQFGMPGRSPGTAARRPRRRGRCPGLRGVNRRTMVKTPDLHGQQRHDAHRPARGRGDAAVLHREVTATPPAATTPSAGRPRKRSSRPASRSPASSAPAPRRSSSPAAPPRATTSPSRAWPRCTRRRATTSSRPSTEHKAVLDPCKRLERDGFQVTFLPVDKYGQVSRRAGGRGADRQDDPRQHHGRQQRDRHAPPDRGRSASSARRRASCSTPTRCRRSARCRVDVEEMGIDLLSLSAHKIYGPKGIGALYVRRKDPRVRLDPHHRRRRPRARHAQRHAGRAASSASAWPASCAARRWPRRAKRLIGLRERLRKGIMDAAGRRRTSTATRPSGCRAT